VTVNLVYQATTVGLNPLQLVLVGTVLEASVFLCEIPTGIVADVYSRRLSVIIGYLLMGLGFIVEAAIPTFAVVLLSQVIWGVGATFLSGAEQAWIADELSHANGGQEESLGRVFLRGTQLAQLGGLIGIGLSVLLGGINVRLPILLGGGLYLLLTIFLIIFMPEDGFTPTPKAERDSWQSMRRTVQSGLQLVRGRPLLLTILAITAVGGMFSEGFDRLWTPHLLNNFTLPTIGNLEPVVWFGIIRAVGMFLTMGATELIRRKIDSDSHHTIVWALIGLTTLLIVGMLGLSLTTSFVLALAALWLIGVMRATIQPLYAAWLNQNISSKVRATMLSVNGQADAIGQIAGGPVVGAIGTIFSLRAALTVAGLLLTPALALYGRSLGQGAPSESAPALGEH
jgi:DHA3 family tetracycline resistance protein-like MFS transporter